MIRMVQEFSAQVLPGKPLPLLSLHFVEREGVRQARGPVIILFQNETDLKQIAANAASEARLRL